MLLAKPDELLIEHTKNVLKVFFSIRKAYPEAPRLCGIIHFWENLFYAAFLHDLGKIAKGFQEELKSGKRWNYRHEILSASFVSALDIAEEDRMAIGLAIITHHKDIQELREKYATYPEDNPGYQKYKNMLEQIDLKEANHFLDLIPQFSMKYLAKELTKFHPVTELDDLTDVYQKYVLPYYQEYRLNKRSSLHGKYGMFLKGFLTACDHLASAKVTTIKRPVQNIETYINFKHLTSVQKNAKKHTGNLFLVSPTGSGKTEAALFWAHNNQNDACSKRIFYILPYTASINYMYKRFLKLFNDDELVGILHGKSGYFLYKFFSQDKPGTNYETAKTLAKKYQSLAKKIYNPYKIMTPFQVIKAFFNLKGFEQNISEMIGGLFIFDEVHSYDPHTIALILEISKFIKKELNGKLLFMTATMPNFLKKYFCEELAIDKEIKMANTELKKYTRHRIRVIDGDIKQYLDSIKKDILSDKKVLVVVNTVKQAQEIFRSLREVYPEKSALLHSKFILRDRERIESGLGHKKLLVGTQVIEVSLDIDYDVLYTEAAPIDALLQRFGRVNRRGIKGIVPIYIFSESRGIDEGRKSIYDKNRAEKSVEVLKKIDILRQESIQEMIDYVYKNGYTEEEWEIITRTSTNFVDFYRNNIPFIDTNKKESDFYTLFKSVEVVPAMFWDKYIDELENKRFYEALKYILPISLWQYNYLKSEQRISKSDFGIMMDAAYDEFFGLEIKKETEDISII